MRGIVSLVLYAIAEMRRRHVFRVVAAYAVFMFVLLQAADIVLPALLVPDWVITVIVVLGIAGLPLAAVLTWVYDITPEGVMRTARLSEAERQALRWNWRWLDYIIIAALAGILIFVLARNPGADAFTGRSIAVLPFSDLSAEQDSLYFSHGMSEAIIDSLARLGGLHVASGTSSFRYRDAAKDVRDVAGELGVDTVLEGSVRKSGDRVVISARLVDGRRGINLWNDTYNGTLEDIFSLQDRISRAIADVLEIRFLGDRPLVPVATGDQTAYDAYLRGRDHLRRGGTPEEIEQAVEEFQRALAHDTDFALAEAGLCTAYWEQFTLTRDTERAAQAIAYCQQAERRGDPRAEMLIALANLYGYTGPTDRARALLQRAREAEPNNAAVYASLGEIMRVDGELEEAEASLKRAIELDPAYFRYQWSLGRVLEEQGRRDEAISWTLRAIRLEPDHPGPYYGLGGMYFYRGDYLKAAEAFRESIDRDPSAPAYANAGTNYFYAGDYEEAEAMYSRAVELSPANFRFHGFLADAISMQNGRGARDSASHYDTAVELAYKELAINPGSHGIRAMISSFLAQTGRTEQAEAELARLEEVDYLDRIGHLYVAMTHLALDRPRQAIEHFSAAVEKGHPAEELLRDPRLLPLYDQPGFIARTRGESLPPDFIEENKDEG